jgi:hypothetical protein
MRDLQECMLDQKMVLQKSGENGRCKEVNKMEDAKK